MPIYYRQSYFSFQLPSAVLSKRVAKFNMKFKNHQNQLRRMVNNLWWYFDVYIFSISKELPVNSLLVKFILWYLFFFLPVYTVNKDEY